MHRRSFVQAAAAVVLGALGSARPSPKRRTVDGTSGTRSVAGTRRLERIGVQLYTVRDRMAEDVAGTLRRVAAIGYAEVEFAGYFDRSPAQIRDLLEETGLDGVAAHVPLSALTGDETARTLDAARTIGHRYVIVPSIDQSMRSSLDGYRRVAEALNRAGEACRAAGLRFAYHNHAFEFERMAGVVPYDLLLQCDPDLVRMELDLFWIASGGGDALEYFERHAGRFDLCHVKDMAADGAMVDVGAGEIDFARLFAAGEPAGLRHFLVEHDTPGDSLASIEASYRHLSALEF